MPLFRGRFVSILVALAAIISLWAANLATAQEAIHVVADEASVNFPHYVDFRLHIQSDEPIVAAELSYGSRAVSCGPVATIGRPDFEPATDLELTWRWPVTDGEIMPPGAQLWWKWRLTTANGQSFETSEQSESFNDRWFVWRTIQEDNLSVHWYRGQQALAEEMMVVGLDILDQMAGDTGLRLTEPIDVYLFDDPAALRAAVPGAPGWIGGIAFPEHNVVLLLAAADYLPVSSQILRHELGHLVFSRLTFNCATMPPTWLAEGLAMMVEGAEDGQLDEELALAIADERLLSLAQLEGSFSVHSRPAGLAYAQSHSLLKFLVDRYGREQLAGFLERLAAGEAFDAALLAEYGLSSAGLETKWREALGAGPNDGTEQTAAGASTPVPTLALVAPAAAPATQPPATASRPPVATAAPTLESPQPTVTQPATNRPPAQPTAAGETAAAGSDEPKSQAPPLWPVALIAFVAGLLLLAIVLLWRRTR